MKSILFFLIVSVQCIAYAQGQAHIFVGQNDKDGVAKVAFILDLIEEDLNDHLLMNDQGEIYLKVDRIVAVPKDNLVNLIALNEMQALPLEQLTQKGDAKLKDLGVSDKLIAQIDSKQHKLQKKLDKSKAKMREHAHQ